MAAKHLGFLTIVYIIGDFLCLNSVFIIVSFYFKWPNLSVDTNFLVQFIYINLFWVTTTFVTRIQSIDRALRFEQIISKLIQAVLLFAIMLISFLYFLEDVLIPVFHVEFKLFFFALSFFVWRSVIAATISFVRRRGLNYRKVIIVGDDIPAKQMQMFFNKHPEAGFKLLGIFSDSAAQLNNDNILGTIDEVETYAKEHGIDEIYCSLSTIDVVRVRYLMDFSDRHLIRFKIIPDFRGFLNKRVSIDFYESVPVLSVRKEPLQNFGNRILKRMFDVVFSLLALIFVMPFAVIIIAPLIKLSSKGPIFFKQLRSGKNNKTFYCYKFRTMQVNDKADIEQASVGDVRITRIGSFLRKTSLDELPQFFNALIGNMSVVGPRPHMLKHTEEYSKYINQFMVRQFLKPGVTGWAQVNGYRGETKEAALMQKRVQYDVWYLENWSLLLDMKIILLTAWQVVSGSHKGG